MTGKGKKKTYKFQADTPQEVAMWIKYIRNEIKSLKEVDNFENIVKNSKAIVSLCIVNFINIPYIYRSQQ